MRRACLIKQLKHSCQMLKNGNLISIRGFHKLHFQCVSQVKLKLGYFQAKQEVLKSTKSESQRKIEAQKTRLKKLQKKAYSRQHAQYILKSKYNVPSKVLESTNVGPTSQSDLKFLTMTRDRRLMYTMLGVTGEQLRDSKLVSNDVTKFLKRGQLEKAVFLVRIARNKGIVGMNKIIEYYCETLFDANSAIDMYTWRKKWGIPPNEYTHTILFNGLAKLRQSLSEKQASKILKIAIQLIEKNELNQIGFNAALEALVNSTNIELVFELYDRKPKSIKNDKITFSILLRALSKVKDDRLCMARTDVVMAQIPRTAIDNQIMYEYCKIWSCRTDSQLSPLAILAIHRLFDIDLGQHKISCPEGVVLPELDYWKLGKRFPVNRFILELFLDCCDKNSQYQLALDTFNKCVSANKQALTPRIFERMIQIVTNGFPTGCSQHALRIFNSMEIEFRSTKSSMILVYKSFERQAGKKLINDDSVKLDKLIHSMREFAMQNESKHSAYFKCSVLEWKAWIFAWNIINRGNERQKLPVQTRKLLLDDFIKTFITMSSNLNTIDKGDRQSLRHVGLECARFVSAFADRYKIEGSLEVAENGPLRENFLFRRMLIRFKSKLLELVKVIEAEGDKLSEPNSSLRDTAELLLGMKAPDA
ncbi:LAFE_0B04434g1_1 [Lachancea fermentati]|uniref:LAFE_0B04434g1_1 n=1 Tax=Lachancea fermentati TaxID=4955 RepID=A0A1G4M7U1_LACFM|nr:LAFE_0B04434g1_1 [Lachancea fermentati]